MRFYNRKTIATLWNTANVFYTPFYETQIINPFLNSMISANLDKVDGLSANGEILIKRIVSLKEILK